jgi:cation diffusion facilitator family transporter
MAQTSLTRFAWLSIGAAIVTIGLKSMAYGLTGSVGLLSDAIESGVNLIGGIMALAMLTVAARPADADHPYGHDKAEYFSSGVEGTLILIAAISIMITAVERLITPKPLEQMGLGLGVSILASLVNLAVALLLLKVSRQQKSITLEANAFHLLTDVWTSVAVVVGIGLVAITGWNRLDPVVAMLVAANIVWTGTRIVQRSIAGLMDKAWPADEQAVLFKLIAGYEQMDMKCHQVATRQAASKRFVSLHVLVPGTWTVQHGHELLNRLEKDIVLALPNTLVATHLEPIDDPSSWHEGHQVKPERSLR